MPCDLGNTSFNFCLCAPTLLSINDLTRGIVFLDLPRPMCTFLGLYRRHYSFLIVFVKKDRFCGYDAIVLLFRLTGFGVV